MRAWGRNEHDLKTILSLELSFEYSFIFFFFEIYFLKINILFLFDNIVTGFTCFYPR